MTEKPTNAFSQRHWSNAERLKVFELYKGICHKIGPNNRLPCANQEQIDKFNNDLKLEGENKRSASGIQKQWRMIHQEFLKMAEKRYPTATQDCMKYTGSDRARKLNHRDQYFNLDIKNDFCKNITDEEVIQMMTREKKEKKKDSSSPAQKKLVLKKRQRDNNESTDDSKTEEIKKLKLMIKSMEMEKMSKDAQLKKKDAELMSMKMQLQSQRRSKALQYAYEYMRLYSEQRNFEFDKHPFDDLKTKDGKEVAPLVGSFASLVQFDLWDSVGKAFEFIQTENVIKFIKKKINEPFVDCLSEYMKKDSTPISVLESMVADQETTYFFIKTSKGVMGPGHYNQLKDIKVIHAKGLGKHSSKTFYIKRVDLTPHRLFFKIFEILWQAVHDSEAGQTELSSFVCEDINIICFERSMTKKKRLDIQNILASDMDSPSPRPACLDGFSFEI